jgi:hypothetical protein
MPDQATVMILLCSMVPQLTIMGGNGASSVEPFQFTFDITFSF